MFEALARISVLTVALGPVLGCSTSTGTTAASRDGSVDAPVPVEANPAECPTLTSILELGTPCSWVGTCRVNLDLCGTGGVSTAAVCTSGMIALPGGATPDCKPDAAPPACSPDTTCSGTDSCQAACGTGLTCLCVQGAYYCPDAFCADAGVCAAGSPCGRTRAVCTNYGAGPCGTDQRLVCGPSGTYGPDIVLCATPTLTCATPVGDAGCSARCSCASSVLTCVTTCDAGG